MAETVVIWIAVGLVAVLGLAMVVCLGIATVALIKQLKK